MIQASSLATSVFETGAWLQHAAAAAIVAVSVLFYNAIAVAQSEPAAGAKATAGPSLQPAPKFDDDRPAPSPSGVSKPQNLRTSRELQSMSRRLIGHGGPIKALRVDAGSKRALTGSFDYSAIVWDIAAPKPRILLRLDAHDGAVNAVAFVPGKNQAVTAGDDGLVRLWDLAHGRLLHRFVGHQGKINAISVSADGRIAASASWDRTARLWDLEARDAGPVLRSHAGPVNAVVFGVRSRRVHTGHFDGTVATWVVRSGAHEGPLLKHGWGINVLEPLADGRWLLFGAVNGSVGVLDASSGKMIASLPSHQRPVLALARLEKPGLIATASGDGVIRVIRQGDWKMLERHDNFFGPIWAMAFADRGATIYYGGLDDFANYWQVSPPKPFEHAQGTYPRRFQVTNSFSEGAKQFARKCSVCHTLKGSGKNRAGPTLHGLFGRKAGALPEYPYSPALKKSDIVWSEKTIGKLFELGPEHYTPGSKMPLQKITNDRQRSELITFLKQATRPAGQGPSMSNPSTK